MPKYFLIYRWHGISPEQIGPDSGFDTATARDAEATRWFREEMDEEDDLSALDIDDDGTPNTWDYSGEFADEAREGV
jgi:hypothetical protein